MSSQDTQSKGEGSPGFYLCLTCFQASEDQILCHGHLMTLVDPGEPGDERRKPLMRGGRLVTHAPRWFLEYQRSQQNPERS